MRTFTQICYVHIKNSSSVLLIGFSSILHAVDQENVRK